MNSTDFARPKTSYRKLYVFQKAEAIYDLTYFFLKGRIAKSDRTHDQMLQAARWESRILWREGRMPLHRPKWKSSCLALPEEAFTNC